MSSTSKSSRGVLLIFLPKDPDIGWIRRIEQKHPHLDVRWVNRDQYRIYGGVSVPNAETETPKEVYEGATIAVLARPPPAEYVPDLRYVQVTSAGADRWIESEVYKNPNVVVCTSNGIQATQIAEWVIGTWLMAQHHFLDFANYQKEEQWKRYHDFSIRDSPGLRMGILGYGAIGRQCARLAKTLGMEIYAYTRRERSTLESRKDDSFVVPGTGDPDGLIPTKWFHGTSRDAVNDFLGQDLDVLVIGLPLTDATKHIIDTAQFDILSRKKTYVINIARGKHIHTEALIAALEQGKIRGAALDVTDPEPLPAGHPLWRAPNLFISPHVSWQSPHYWDRVLAILEINLERMREGKGMINVIDKEHHY